MIFAALLAAGVAAKGIAVNRERARGEILQYFDINTADFGAAQFQHAERKTHCRGVRGKRTACTEIIA